MNKKVIRRITDNALIAGIYYIFTIILGTFAYNDIQFRIAEILLFLPFFRKDFVIGVTLGTFLANLQSPLWPWDPIFGTLATLISALLISYSRKMWTGIIYPTIINGLIIGTMLHIVLDLPLFPTMGFVALGEVVVLSLGYAIFALLSKNKPFLNLIMAEEGKKYD